MNKDIKFKYRDCDIEIFESKDKDDTLNYWIIDNGNEVYGGTLYQGYQYIKYCVGYIKKIVDMYVDEGLFVDDEFI